MLASAYHTTLNGWDVVVALLVLLVAVVLSRIVTEIPWVAWTTLFLVALFGVALTVRF